MSDDERASWSADLLARIRAVAGYPPASHVAFRISNVLAPLPVRFVNVDLKADTSDDASGFSGRIVVFTDELVAVADLTSIPAVDTWDEAERAGVVRVRVLGRSALVRMDIRPGDDATEDNAIWEDGWRGWPARAQMQLVYDGLDEPITVPHRRAAASFRDFVPSLAEDLARP